MSGINPVDLLDRPLGSLRLSVTDRCNIRCQYCMPEDDYVWLPKSSILTFEQTQRLTRIFVRLGVRRVRITGGEPLLRQDLAKLVRGLAAIDGVEDVAMTTNGILLDRYAAALHDAGMNRVTVSLDTLDRGRFEFFTKSKRFDDVVAGIDAAVAVGFDSVKMNAVVIRGLNDDELVPLLEFAGDRGVELRFIEYMDVGGATQWSSHSVVSRCEILERVTAEYGNLRELRDGRGTAPAERFAVPDGRVFGIISSTTAPFCSQCDRSRVTADGVWYLCLYAEQGIGLKEMLEAGATDREIESRVAEVWRGRSDRGAEDRLGIADRGVLYQIKSLRGDPHREMHTRGG